MYTRWKCQAHVQERLNSQSLEHLKEFVHSHGGQVDMQQATIRVDLGSVDEANQFQTHLSDAGYTFDISIKLNWKVTRSNVKHLCLGIGNTGTHFLELDGITLDVNPQSYNKYRNNFFFHDIISKSNLLLMTLLNYPRPQELCIHVYQYSLQFKKSPTRFSQLAGTMVRPEQVW